ncbi:hypothetical protein [Polyangium jinanense]|uniref:Protein kinase domain-containing protein n=1 Tax=Polyangium jinanense TaxID=2829994 RepID=A0A9X3X0P9_9BACT|nr:hypothetical protein [Polyangium jinanense]MDC3954087.1 hypothetical protein [Polyangium jinanense]MDC3981957.1 hypothetical protein [Polyangium jinanense]
METLADRIARDGPLNELDAVGWIIRLTKKLEALHSRGQSHGGVSPAAVKTAAVPRTSVGMLVASASAPSRIDCHSPERILKGTKALADDTWAAAATLYTLLTGTSPFHASDEDSIRQKVVSASPAPLSTFDVGDDDLQHILDAALERDATRRASTITALRQALESWHPDPTVKDLPALVDAELEEDDDEARTVMRAVPNVQAVRAAMAKREPGPAPSSRTTAQTVPNMPAVSALAAATVPGAPLPRAHDLLEDDDENAKTSLMKVPMVPVRKPAPSGPNLAPGAAAPASGNGPASAGVRPVGPQPGTGFGMMGGRAPGGPAARAAARPAAGARPAQPAAPAAAAKAPLAPPVGGISREAVIDDGDDEDATVMREAPLELLRQTKQEDGPEADRATPVNPISAEVAAAATGPVIRDEPTPPGPHAIDDEATVMREMPEPPPAQGPAPVPVPAPDMRAPEPTMVLPEESSSTSLPANLADLAPQPQPPMNALPDLFASVSDERPPLSPEQAMRAAAMPQPSPFAVARESAPSPFAAARESAPSPFAAARESAPSPFAAARESAPSPRVTPPPPLARESAPSPRVTPPPPVVMQPAQPAPPSTAKGLLLGALIALVLLAVGASVYFTLLKK